MKKQQLHIYIDESGTFEPCNKNNPTYSVAFVMVDESFDNKRAIEKFVNKTKDLVGGNHFVHVGNLVRGERPYEEMFRSDRWYLFHSLFMLALFAKYYVKTVSVIKESNISTNKTIITNAIIDALDSLKELFAQYVLVVHYDYGQNDLTNILINYFKSRYKDCAIIKTNQSDSIFMQLADFYAYMQLLKFKINKGYLTNSENKFFGGIKQLRKSYIKQLDDKYL